MPQIKDLTYNASPSTTALIAIQDPAGGPGSTESTALSDLPGGGGGGIVTVLADDEDVTVDAFNGTTIVLYTALTDARHVFLPTASGPAQQVVVIDVNGQAIGDGSVTLVPDGDDTVQVSLISGPNGELIATNDGVSAWVNVMGNPFPQIGAYGLDVGPSYASPMPGFSGLGGAPHFGWLGFTTTFANSADLVIGWLDKGTVALTAGNAGGGLQVVGINGGQLLFETGGVDPGGFCKQSVFPGATQTGPLFLAYDSDGETVNFEVDADGTIFIRGNIPTSDPHSLGKVFRTGTALQVSQG